MSVWCLGCQSKLQETTTGVRVTRFPSAFPAKLGASHCPKKQAKKSLGSWAASGDKKAQEP